MKKILFVGGSLNQTTICHAVARHLENEYACWFSPFFVDGLYEPLRRAGLLDVTVAGGNQRRRTECYLQRESLPVDYRGKRDEYDLYVFVSDILLPRRVRNKPLLLIQEGMTDPEGLMYQLTKALRLPLYFGGTSTTGLSDAYQHFCVASEGYRDLFIRKGVNPDKLRVTGIPNFDHAAGYLDNDFPHRDYVLVATSDSRETLKRASKRPFLEWAAAIADGRPMIFKLHPNENFERSTREIKPLLPDAMVLTRGNTEHMIANAQALITEHSSCIYVGLALGKECHSYVFDMDELRRLMPMQNGGTSGARIAEIVREIVDT